MEGAAQAWAACEGPGVESYLSPGSWAPRQGPGPLRPSVSSSRKSSGCSVCAPAPNPRYSHWREICDLETPCLGDRGCGLEGGVGA